MAAKKVRVVVVNDHQDFLNLMTEFLTDEGYDVISLAKHQGAFETIKELQPDIVICDLIMDNMPAGWALLDMLVLDPETRPIPVILCTAATRQVQEVAPSLMSKGIQWLEKPFELEALLKMLETVRSSSANRLRGKNDA